MDKPFDPTKPFTLRDGTAARLLGTIPKGPGEYTLAIAYNLAPDWETIGERNPNGRVYQDCEAVGDLVNIPEKRTVWVYGIAYQHEIGGILFYWDAEQDGAWRRVKTEDELLVKPFPVEYEVP